MKVKRLLCLCCLCPLLSSQAGSVRLITGERYEGKVDLVPDGIVVTPDHGGAPIKVDLPNLQEAMFGTRTQSSTDLVPPGALLINGSFVAGQVTAFDASAVKLGSAGISVPGSAIAQVVFAPIRRSKLPPPAGGRTGAILPDGDFFAGTVDGMKDNRLQINSILLGPQRLVPGSQAAGVVIRDVQNAVGGYKIVSRDGSEYQMNDLKVDKDGVLITDSIMGSVRIKTDDLVEIRGGVGRYQNLVDGAPARVDVPAGVNPANAFQVQAANAVPGVADPSLLTLVNAMVSYAVPPGFTIFTSSVTLPQGAPPAAHLIFDVYADGRLVFGSPIVAAGQNPQPIRVSMGPVRLITLRVEPAGPGSNGATGEWIDPLFLRP